MYIAIDDIAITHLVFDEEFTNAIERKQVAQQDVERVKVRPHFILTFLRGHQGLVCNNELLCERLLLLRVKHVERGTRRVTRAGTRRTQDAHGVAHLALS